ncbi:trafficking kinesin-binding protein 2-like [Mixophyes fleayi]|uniref:trafficking kinesin-binding protein 2-like n=1 Tax=Mixophyes fleayi TaxID=3061075 RepID=UPI003F4DF3DD
MFYVLLTLPVLGSEKIDQMSRSYNDTDMLSHLLTERDRDLELAARIGQALLKRNHILTEQNESLEEQLTQALDHERDIALDERGLKRPTMEKFTVCLELLITHNYQVST